MKKILLTLLIGLQFFGNSHGQSNTDLLKRIESLERRVNTLKTQILDNETKILNQGAEIEKLKLRLNGDPIGQDNISNDSDVIETNVQIQSNYPGGEAAFREYIAGEFIYPERCQKEAINGSVKLRFVVDEAGRISRIKAIEETTTCPEFTIEAIRVLQKSPRWVPGQNDGNFLKSWREIKIQLSAPVSGVITNNTPPTGNSVSFATTFFKYSITSNYRYTQTDVYGTIVARVKIGCDGNWSVVEWNVKGTSWYGGENEMTRVFRDFIKESKFYKIDDNCGETALITLNVRKTF